MGEPNVERLQETIDSAQFARWIAFYRIDPFGEQRADLRNALLLSTVARMLGDKTPDLLERFMLFDDATTVATRRERAEAWERWKATGNA